MTIKKLTAEGRFECGLDEIMAGKLYAFVAIVESSGYSLGVAVANEAGYTPIPKTWCHGDSYAEMDGHADELNTALGHTEETAMRIIASSMAQGKPKKKPKPETCEDRGYKCCEAGTCDGEAAEHRKAAGQ